MQLIDWILVAGIGAVLVFCVLFICKSKKAGNKCIGCPHSGNCSGGCGYDK